MEDANTYYLNDYLNKESDIDRQAEAAEVDAVRIFNQMIEDLKKDTSNSLDNRPGWNLYCELNDIADMYWLPLAAAIQDKDYESIGKLIFEAVTNQLAKEAKYQAEEKLENGDYK